MTGSQQHHGEKTRMHGCGPSWLSVERIMGTRLLTSDNFSNLNAFISQSWVPKDITGVLLRSSPCTYHFHEGGENTRHLSACEGEDFCFSRPQPVSVMWFLTGSPYRQKLAPVSPSEDGAGDCVYESVETPTLFPLACEYCHTFTTGNSHSRSLKIYIAGLERVSWLLAACLLDLCRPGIQLHRRNHADI